MSRDIETQVEHDGVGTLTLARPGRRNALSINMRDEITQQLDDWAADPAVRVVVLTGAGPTFCAGFDLNEFGQVDSRGGSRTALAATTSPYGISPSHWSPP